MNKNRQGLKFSYTLAVFAVGVLSLGTPSFAETPEEALAQLVKDIRLMTPTLKAAFKDGRYITKPGDTLDMIIAQTMDENPVRKELLRKAIVHANPHAFKRKNPNWMYANRQLKLPTADDIHSVVFKDSGGILSKKRAEQSERQSWVKFP